MMNNQRNRTKIIASILALTIVATMFMAFAPMTFGQYKIPMSCSAGAPSDRSPVPMAGVGQTVYLTSVIWPFPEYSVDMTFTITKPDGTIEELVAATTTNSGEARIDYVVDQAGIYEVEASWEGDATHTDTDDDVWFEVTEGPVTLPTKLKTYAYVAPTPPTIGQGQTIYIVGWITPPRDLLGAVFSDYTFTITKPDGSQDTRFFDTSLSEATRSFGYVCDQIGTWSATLSFPGARFYTAATSESATWTVQAEAVPLPPLQPLPDYPWEYPVSAEYREWYQITGSWPQSQYDAGQTNFNPYSEGPNTPHIIWKRNTDAVGIVGQLGYSGIAGFGPNPVAVYGRLYYLEPRYEENTQIPVIVCLDQFTGEELFRTDLRGTGSGGTLYVEFEQRFKMDPKYGVRPSGIVSLWAIGGGGVREIDPANGRTIYYNANLPSGDFHDGAIYFMDYNGETGESETGTMTKWDTRFKTTMLMMDIPRAAEYGTFWTENLMMRGSQGRGGFPVGQTVYVWDTDTGELIVDGAVVDFYSTESTTRTCTAYRKWYFHCSTTRSVHAVDLDTGQLAWTGEPDEAPWGVFGSYDVGAGYGNYYQGTWDGYVSCYDAETGVKKWKTYLDDNFDQAMGHNVPWGRPIIADGKIYIASCEHTYPTPIPTGNKYYCLDAYTGDKIWEMPFYNAEGGISSGVLFVRNEYDGCLYNFAKGPSATTVSVQQNVVAKGASALITGTVTDQSAGAKDTPAIADEDMGPWMEYMYMNKPMPTDATGVPVALVAISSDGNVIDIGQTTSTDSGQFSKLWTPPDEGTYRIIANFGGSESYYSSWGEAALGVTDAPSPAGPIEPEPTAGLGITEIAIIAAVVVAVIVGVVAYWALKKQRK